MEIIEKGEESYEDVRRRKLEENKRKFDELNLGHLSVALRESRSPKSSLAKQVKRKAPIEEFAVKRRSNRLANLPEEDYSEAVHDLGKLPRIVASLLKSTRPLEQGLASNKSRAYAQEKALEVEKELGTQFPSFVKSMLPSNTSGKSCLGLSTYFCNRYLPKNNCLMTLIDENGEESDTTYFAQRKHLGAGWRRFSVNHLLVDGDALVFQLIKPTAFKVYIIREKDYRNIS